MAALFAAVSAAVPSVSGSCVPSVSHCLANDTSSSHCLASIYNIYSVCLAEASSYSEIAQASSYSYADRALELGKSAATWQLVVALYVALLVLRMHGRFILWSWLTMLPLGADVIGLPVQPQQLAQRPAPELVLRLQAPTQSGGGITQCRSGMANIMLAVAESPFTVLPGFPPVNGAEPHT